MESKKLVSLFQEDLCIFSLRSRKKSSVLLEMVRQLKASGKIADERFILEMLKNRESLGSTGLGLGVAFPHGRSIAISDLTVLFARAASGVDFESLDGEPTRVFFLILAPSEKGAEPYLALLSKLTALVQQPETLEKLYTVKNFASLQAVLGGDSE
ncbi:MAG: PTS sugar transporter subunit IIA [Candidatus Krumholzibacteria bacterium]|nr:PTS sugar transporter subunit IIA [Candidatus Krumholzibacteria bacterium]